MTFSQSKLAIIGFGSQAKAWALNLRDSKINVTIVLRKGSPSIDSAKNHGFQVCFSDEDLKQFSIFLMLFPDDQHLHFLQKFQTYLPPKAHLIYGHGFSLSKHQLRSQFPQFIHSLIAPKAIASEVRFQYEIQGKIGAVLDIGDPSPSIEEELRGLAKLAGITSLYLASYEEETKADLFSEQSLLCSILPYVSLKSYKLLRKNGISKEVAFMECFLELKSISAAFVQLGPQAFFKLISPNALIGAEKGRDLLLGPEFDTQLEKIWQDIENQKFYKEVEVDSNIIRERVLSEWSQEELTQVYLDLKNELIN